ncbi:MAG: hypothetical protein Q8P62_02995 [Candidatus Peregrinibacteria bacterium]|nr:hypothetical protein [Candidatus Peregrinibacteria bacterium]
MKTKPVDLLIKDKSEAKNKLSSMLKFHIKKPLIALFVDKELSEMEERNLTIILDGIKDLEATVIAIADTNSEIFADVKTMEYNRMNRHYLLEAADIALVFSFTDVEEILANGIIPVSYERPEVKNYDPNHESGNAFIYKTASPWSVFAALVRAVETFKFPYDWKHIIRQGLI